MSRDQLVQKFIEDEKQWFGYTEDEWKLLANEYESKLAKLGIDEAEKFEVIGPQDDEVVYDLGNTVITVCGQGLTRRLSMVK